ncbi:unnamed protein product [Brachionus calyciflorus]|uniref:Uncharacterized protein n=1 Tax=Brachionus calyciflorus TaxID=104777 RepID=A0A813RPR6_9BILA|nr:unnamed protein product [Brachionus calyciflorus]
MLAQNETSHLDPITELCLQVYPDQVDVLQATTQIQYWLNGPDPLDYVNIYINNDEDNNGLNSHFHYVSLGLTDLYGDERVHKRAKSLEENSGFGYELTIRVKKESNQNEPPKWPIKLLQALAKYTFTTGGILDEGDHVPNVLLETSSKIKHILVCEDLHLKCSKTKHGKVKFLQIVGCTDDELKFSQQWSSRKVLDLMRKFKELGNEYLLVDLNRSKSIFEIDLNLKRRIIRTIRKEGSFLSFVKSKCFWRLNLETWLNDGTYSIYNQINFNIDLDTAKLFPTILKQRLDKGNSFIFNGLDDRNLILIPNNFGSSFCYVTTESPIQSNGMECQILISQKLLLSLCNYFQDIKIDMKENIDAPIMKLTIEYLKQEAHNFDLECVFVLDLSKKGIVEVEEIRNCVNLEILNLSDNGISDLTNLKELSKLHQINLSNNNIISLKGLECLESLKTLNLAGNKIQDIHEFYQLKKLKNLTHIVLNDSRKKISNPICSNYKNYKTELKRIFPKLEFIDGDCTKIEIPSLDNKNDESLNEFKKSFLAEETEHINHTKSWFDQVENYSDRKINIQKILKSLNEQRGKFKDMYEELAKSIETANILKTQPNLKTLSKD